MSKKSRVFLFSPSSFCQATKSSSSIHFLNPCSTFVRTKAANKREKQLHCNTEKANYHSLYANSAQRREKWEIRGRDLFFCGEATPCDYRCFCRHHKEGIIFFLFAITDLREPRLLGLLSLFSQSKGKKGLGLNHNKVRGASLQREKNYLKMYNLTIKRFDIEDVMQVNLLLSQVRYMFSVFIGEWQTQSKEN